MLQIPEPTEPTEAAESTDYATATVIGPTEQSEISVAGLATLDSRTTSKKIGPISRLGLYLYYIYTD